MAEIRRFPILRHLRAEPSHHVLLFRNGQLKSDGRGLSFWFAPWAVGIAEVPIEDREAQLMAHGRTNDFQDVAVQGVITYRVTDPALLAQRIDFTIDLVRGRHVNEPLEVLAGRLTQLAQQHAAAYLVGVSVRELLVEGPDPLRTHIEAALAIEHGTDDLGVEIVSVRISAVRPSPDVEKALESPTRERIQQDADEAAFARRAMAVENERAIEENEMKTRVELARQEEDLIAQHGANQRHEAESKREALQVEAEGEASRARLAAGTEAERIRLDAGAQAERTRLTGAAEAERIALVETASANAELVRLDGYRDLPPAVVFGLAARELATKLEHIGHLNLAPELLTPLIADWVQAGTRASAAKMKNGG